MQMNLTERLSRFWRQSTEHESFIVFLVYIYLHYLLFVLIRKIGPIALFLSFSLSLAYIITLYIITEHLKWI